MNINNIRKQGGGNHYGYKKRSKKEKMFGLQTRKCRKVN